MRKILAVVALVLVGCSDATTGPTPNFARSTTAAAVGIKPSQAAVTYLYDCKVTWPNEPVLEVNAVRGSSLKDAEERVQIRYLQGTVTCLQRTS